MKQICGRCDGSGEKRQWRQTEACGMCGGRGYIDDGQTPIPEREAMVEAVVFAKTRLERAEADWASHGKGGLIKLRECLVATDELKATLAELTEFDEARNPQAVRRLDRGRWSHRP